MRLLYIYIYITLTGSFMSSVASKHASLTTIWIRRDPAINDNLINAGTTFVSPGANPITVSVTDNRPGQLQTRIGYYSNGSTEITSSEPDYASSAVIY